MIPFFALAFLATCHAATQNVSYEVQMLPSDSQKLDLDLLILKKHSYNQRIQDLIDSLEISFGEVHANILSGEGSQQFTRQSASLTNANGILSAIAYAQDRMTSYGFSCERHQYRSDWGPNLICSIAGSLTPSRLVILGAHIDDIPASGRAPGANDDGSGSAALLAIAQTIQARRATFQNTLVLEFYTGEEQGLVGSRSLAARRRQQGNIVVAHIQSDMTAVRLPNDPAGLAFVQDPRASNPTLTAYVENLARQYSRSPFTIYRSVLSGSSCCSDHQSYHENGFPSVGLIEPRGYTGDPQYHRVGDIVQRSEYDLTQLALSARIALAAAADIAVLN